MARPHRPCEQRASPLTSHSAYTQATWMPRGVSEALVHHVKRGVGGGTVRWCTGPFGGPLGLGDP